MQQSTAGKVTNQQSASIDDVNWKAVSYQGKGFLAGLQGTTLGRHHLSWDYLQPQPQFLQLPVHLLHISHMLSVVAQHRGIETQCHALHQVVQQWHAQNIDITQK